MNKQKVILIPSVDSPVNVFAKFTKGKRYNATAFAGHSGELLYKVRDDKGREYTAYQRSSHHLGGRHFDIEYPFEDCSKRDSFAHDDNRTFAVIRAGIDLALSDASCESFMREPFSRIAELEKQVTFLTGELQEAHAKIEKVREIMRSEPGYDIEDHARVLRMMADAFAKLQR